jgi:3-keto-disaccharide hydrolase
MKLLVLAALFVSSAALGTAQVDPKWEIHDRNRPVPAVVTPGTASTQDAPGKPPSDAIVLFDGKDLSQWVVKKDDSPAKWKVENGYFEVVAKTGDIRTKDSFGDCQLHVEFREPDPPKGEDQDRGNSGVFLMGLYEIQVLDSYNSKTYADGQASAVYGQYPPLVNASHAPGQWQSYDIIWHGPRFDADGKLTRPAHATVFHNGVLTQDNVELTGPTGHHVRPPYTPTLEKLPLALQDHNHPVRYRNIWIRELKTAGRSS